MVCVNIVKKEKAMKIYYGCSYLNFIFFLQMANQINVRAGLILSDALALNISAADLEEEVATAESGVDELDQAVVDDREAIAVVTCTANDTIVLAEDILERITIVNVRISKMCVC